METARKRRPLTPTGELIKRRLIALDMTQAEFCRRYGINQQRFSDACRTRRTAIAERKKICDILNISESERDIC